MEGMRMFILGKNKELSIAEILAWLESRSIPFKVRDIGKYFMSVGCGSWPHVDQLGGTIKIARPVMVAEAGRIEAALKGCDMSALFPEGGSFVFGISLYGTKNTDPEMQKTLAMIVKRRLAEEGKKARFMPSRPGEPWLSHVEVIKKEMIEKSADVCVCIAGDRAYIGVTEQVHNPFEFKKRDTDRPSQRSALSIPPRLAKMLVNLCGAKRNILDPFCGIGTILQEAALNNIPILGVDRDVAALGMCRKNLMWISKEYNLSLGNLNESIARGDSAELSRLVEGPVDGIATEPPLGPLLRSRPGFETAVQIITGLEPLYSKTLTEMRKVLGQGCMIAMTFPRFISRGKAIRMDAEGMARKAGLKVYDVLEKHRIPHIYPVLDYEPRHNVIREVHVFRKG